MIPGPDKIIECPNCKGFARVFTLVSGNTFGARRWTDGKMIAPMLPRPPAITKCRDCGHYFWLSDAKKVGELPSLWGVEEKKKIPPEWRTAEHVRELSEAEYFEAIKKGAAEREEQELHLRIGAWWAGNDLLRYQGQSFVDKSRIVARSPEATMNLESLLELLNIGDSDQRLMKAEVLRELGRFEEAIRLLEFDFPSEYGSVVVLIRNLAQKKDPIVREIL